MIMNWFIQCSSALVLLSSALRQQYMHVWYVLSLTYTNFILCLIDPPGPASSPDIADVGKDFASITWTKPDDDGGSQVTGYIVEKTEAGADRWVRWRTSPPLEFASDFCPNF